MNLRLIHHLSIERLSRNRLRSSPEVRDVSPSTSKTYQPVLLPSSRQLVIPPLFINSKRTIGIDSPPSSRTESTSSSRSSVRLQELYDRQGAPSYTPKRGQYLKDYMKGSRSRAHRNAKKRKNAHDDKFQVVESIDVSSSHVEAMEALSQQTQISSTSSGNQSTQPSLLPSFAFPLRPIRSSNIITCGNTESRDQRVRRECLDSRLEIPIDIGLENDTRVDFGQKLSLFHIAICSLCSEGHLLITRASRNNYVCARCKKGGDNYFAIPYANPGN